MVCVVTSGMLVGCWSSHLLAEFSPVHARGVAYSNYRLCSGCHHFLWFCGCCLPLVLGCFLVAEVMGIVAELFWPC